MQEPENLIRILEGTIQAIKNNDVFTIRDLSNHTVNTASTTQDPDNIVIAVIVYSLSKILERKDYRELTGWNRFYKNTLEYLSAAKDSLKSNKPAAFSKHLESIRKEIDHLSGKLKKYIQEVFRSAQINKASRLYEHGISMERTSKLLGITLWELANYSGETGIANTQFSKTKSAKERIGIALEAFK